MRFLTRQLRRTSTGAGTPRLLGLPPTGMFPLGGGSSASEVSGGAGVGVDTARPLGLPPPAAPPTHAAACAAPRIVASNIIYMTRGRGGIRAFRMSAERRAKLRLAKVVEVSVAASAAYYRACMRAQPRGSKRRTRRVPAAELRSHGHGTGCQVWLSNCRGWRLNPHVRRLRDGKCVEVDRESGHISLAVLGSY